MLGRPADHGLVVLQLDDLSGGLAVGPFQESHDPLLPAQPDPARRDDARDPAVTDYRPIRTSGPVSGSSIRRP